MTQDEKTAIKEAILSFALFMCLCLCLTYVFLYNAILEAFADGIVSDDLLRERIFLKGWSYLFCALALAVILGCLFTALEKCSSLTRHAKSWHPFFLLAFGSIAFFIWEQTVGSAYSGGGTDEIWLNISGFAEIQLPRDILIFLAQNILLPIGYAIAAKVFSRYSPIRSRVYYLLFCSELFCLLAGLTCSQPLPDLIPRLIILTCVGSNAYISCRERWIPSRHPGGQAVLWWIPYGAVSILTAFVLIRQNITEIMTQEPDLPEVFNPLQQIRLVNDRSGTATFLTSGFLLMALLVIIYRREQGGGTKIISECALTALLVKNIYAIGMSSGLLYYTNVSRMLPFRICLLDLMLGVTVVTPRLLEELSAWFVPEDEAADLKSVKCSDRFVSDEEESVGPNTLHEKERRS